MLQHNNREVDNDEEVDREVKVGRNERGIRGMRARFHRRGDAAMANQKKLAGDGCVLTNYNPDYLKAR